MLLMIFILTVNGALLGISSVDFYGRENIKDKLPIFAAIFLPLSHLILGVPSAAVSRDDYLLLYLLQLGLPSALGLTFCALLSKLKSGLSTVWKGILWFALLSSNIYLLQLVKI